MIFNRSLLFASLSVAVLAAANADNVAIIDDPAVVKLTGDNFASFLEDNSLFIAEFFAPWCGHCKALAPEFKAAAHILKDDGIAVAQVDCTENQELCQEHEVRGYPTLKVFKNQKEIPYNDARKSDAIVSFLQRLSLPAVIPIDSADALDKIVESSKTVSIGFFNEKDVDSEFVKAFGELAEDLRTKYTFAATNSTELAKKYGAKAPTVGVFKSNKDEEPSFFTIPTDSEEELKESIGKFVAVESFPLIGVIDGSTFGSYMESGLPLAYIFYDSPSNLKKLTKYAIPLAKKYKGKINFVTIDANAFGKHAENLNLIEQWPAFSIHDVSNNLKYVHEQDNKITEKSLIKVVEGFVDGTLEPKVKSEEVPEIQEGPVITVVGKNFQDIVNDSQKDVLLEYYAPWCGHCKNLAPHYAELASLYFDNKKYSDKVVVAKVDHTANDVPGEIAGYPTIVLFPAGDDKTPIVFKGNRDVESLAQFIKEAGSLHIDAFAEEEEDDEEVEETEVEVEVETATASEAPKETKEEEVAHDEL